jgi:hypothetical protein
VRLLRSIVCVNRHPCEYPARTFPVRPARALSERVHSYPASTLSSEWPSAMAYWPLQYPCECCIRTRGRGRPRRSFYSNSLDGTIPAALSALKLLQTLCVRPARNAARCAAVPLLHTGIRVRKCSCGYRARILPVPVYEFYASILSSGPVQCGTA